MLLRVAVFACGTEVTLWTADYVAQRLRSAARTLQRLPLCATDRPAGHRTYWPDVVEEYWDKYNRLSRQRRDELMAEHNHVRFIPTPEDIDSMDEALQWMFILPDNARDNRIVWATAIGIPYRKISRGDGRSHQRCQQIFEAACERIAEHLNTP